MKSFVTFVFLFFCLFVFFSGSRGNPYNKYGRSCKDILCTVREECVMERDECTSYSDKCGAYPTCKRKAGSKPGCASMKCPSGHFCSIRQENCARPPCEIKPTCIAFRTPAPSRQSSSNAYNSNSRPSSNQYNSRNNQRNQNRWSSVNY